MNSLKEHKGKSASLSGSFNPLHYDHIGAVEELYNMGYSKVYLFVRDNLEGHRDWMPEYVYESIKNHEKTRGQVW